MIGTRTALLLLLGAAVAWADEGPSGQDVGAARRLTEEGAKALSQGRHERASERFTEALARIPGIIYRVVTSIDEWSEIL